MDKHLTYSLSKRKKKRVIEVFNRPNNKILDWNSEERGEKTSLIDSSWVWVTKVYEKLKYLLSIILLPVKRVCAFKER